MEEKFLSKADIYNTIKMLSRSQGFYCHVLNAIDDDNSILDELEKQHFKDSIDLIMFLEC